jgi:hypothetical protein
MESKSYLGTGENSEETNLSAATGQAPIPVKAPAWGEQGRATAFKSLIHLEDTAQKRAILDTLY